MKKSFLSSVILTAVIGLSTSAFASTQVTAKAEKNPVKVETKSAASNHKKVAQKPVAKVNLKKADTKVATKTTHTMEKKDKKVVAKPAHSMEKKAK